jgi:signal transduction histidine kinase
MTYRERVSTAGQIAGSLRRWWLPPTGIDIVIALAFISMSVAEAALTPSVISPLQHLLVAVPCLGSLAWRRHFPLAVALIVVAGNLYLNPAGQFAILLSIVLVAFTVGSETAPPRSYVGLGVVLVPFLTVSIVEGLEPSDLAAALVFIVGPWVVGTTVRQRAERAKAAVARAEQLELDATQAAEAERTRIARELHDIVSHSISVVTIQTQAVRRRLGPEHGREAADLAAVEATARQALAEMRRLFGVLRADGESAALAPQPGVAELGRLVEQANSPEIAVRLTVEGEPYDLPPGVDLAAYRIAQEGLTNALRHSRASHVEVVLRYRPASLDVEVIDDGRGLDSASAGGGHGLIGVRERVSLYGGSVELGPVPGGGTTLRAQLPVGERG